METIERKARHFFETTPHARNVTFDDAKQWRRNLPWLRYVGAHWGYAEPDTIRVEIDEWVVFICGHKLGPLFRAIEEQVLASITAHPEWKNEMSREPDTFATSIRFVRFSTLVPASKRPSAIQRKLDLP